VHSISRYFLCRSVESRPQYCRQTVAAEFACRFYPGLHGDQGALGEFPVLVFSKNQHIAHGVLLKGLSPRYGGDATVPAQSPLSFPVLSWKVSLPCGFSNEG